MTTSFQASAPGRCGIVGNPSDIYGGAVVSCSIPARNSCTLTLGETTALPDDARLWHAAIARFPILKPVSVAWHSDIPRSSGLSGSTATLAATLLCVLAARAETPDLEAQNVRRDFAELVRDVERREADIVCGYQDAYMIVHGGLQFMEFPGKHPINSGPQATLRELSAPLPFLLITTGVERLSGSVHGPMAQRWLAGEAAVVSGMERIAQLGRDGASALGTENWTELGRLMLENHAIIASLGGSGPAIDALIAACLDSGAVAAKLAGAGLGGTVIALAEEPAELQDRLAARGYSRFMRPAATPGACLT
ncbi:MAG: GHMP family kinase ATP-binding protein [Fimbriimonadaceae bacterium]